MRSIISFIVLLSMFVAPAMSVAGDLGEAAKFFAGGLMLRGVIREQSRSTERVVKAIIAPQIEAARHLAPAQAEAIKMESANRFANGQKLRETGTPNHLVAVMNGSYSATSVGDVQNGGMAYGAAAVPWFTGSFGGNSGGWYDDTSALGAARRAQIEQRLSAGNAVSAQQWAETARLGEARRQFIERRLHSR